MATAAAGGAGRGYGRGNGGDDDDPYRFRPYKFDPLHLSEVYRADNEDDDTDDPAHRTDIPDYVVNDSAAMSVDGSTTGVQPYRGIQSERNGFYVSYLHCRDPPSTKSVKVWLGCFSSATAAAMAYDVFSIFNHHDSLVNFPQFLHIYLHFVPRRGITRKGASLPLDLNEVERVKHIGVGIIRAFYPNTYINVESGTRRSFYSKRANERRAAEYAQIEQTTRDSVHSFMQNQQATALHPGNPTLSKPSSAVNNLDFSSIQIPHPPHPSTDDKSQPQHAMSPPIRQAALSSDPTNHNKLLNHDPSRHPPISSHRYGRIPSRFRRRSTSYAQSLHHKQFDTRLSERRSSDPGPYYQYPEPRADVPLSKPLKALYDSADCDLQSMSKQKLQAERAEGALTAQEQNLNLMNKQSLYENLADDLLGQYDGERAYLHRLQNASMVEGLENAQAGASQRRSNQYLAAHADERVSLRQDPLACSVLNADYQQGTQNYDVIQYAQEAPSGSMNNLVGSRDLADGLELKAHGNHDVNDKDNDQQKTVPLQRRTPSQLEFFDFFKSRSNATAAGGSGPEASSSSIKMQENNNVDTTLRLGGRSEDSVDMEPFVRRRPYMPDLNLPLAVPRAVVYEDPTQQILEDRESGIYMEDN